MIDTPVPPGKPPLRARLPLLDRLLDADPGAPEMPSPSAAEALDRLRSAVRRDLEAMLNTRRRRRPLPILFPELQSSIFNYGIPDPTSGAYAASELRAALVREIETTIRRFEPRLTNVTVTLVSDEADLGTALRMKVEAALLAEQGPEDVSFETLLEPVTRDITVRELQAP